MMYDQKSMTLGNANETQKNTDVLDDPGIPKRSTSLIIGNESPYFPFNNWKTKLGEEAHLLFA